MGPRTNLRELGWDCRFHASRLRLRLREQVWRIRGSADSVPSDELIEVSPDICTNLLGFSYSMNGWHYLTALLRDYTDNVALRYDLSILRRFHDRFQPADMSAMLPDPSVVSFRPPVGIHPWGSFNLALSAIGGEPKRTQFSRQYGPTRAWIVKWDFSTLIDLYERIRIEGYRPAEHESGFVAGSFLCRSNGERRFYVLDGTHRCAILSFLGVRSVTMRYMPGYFREVHESDVDSWYYVRTGQCSRADALAYFHAYFEMNGLERAARLGLVRPGATLRTKGATL